MLVPHKNVGAPSNYLCKLMRKHLKRYLVSDRKQKQKQEPELTRMEGESKEDVWCRETVPKVLKLVCSTLPLSLSHTNLVSLLLVSPSLHRTLLCSQPLWQVLTPLPSTLLIFHQLIISPFLFVNLLFICFWLLISHSIFAS